MIVLCLYLCFVVRDFQGILIDQMCVSYFLQRIFQFFIVFVTFFGRVFKVSIDSDYQIRVVVLGGSLNGCCISINTVYKEGSDLIRGYDLISCSIICCFLNLSSLAQ